MNNFCLMHSSVSIKGKGILYVKIDVVIYTNASYQILDLIISPIIIKKQIHETELDLKLICC